MLIDNTNSFSEQNEVAQKKSWQTPQCTSKRWQTPRLTSLPFNETSSGTQAQPEHSPGTIAS
jgi:hypothetical protein